MAFGKENVSKGHILASKLPGSNTPILESMKPRNTSSLAEWGHIDAAEIISIIKSDIHTNKSSGFDGVPGKLIKSCAHIIGPKLSDVFNKFIELGTYPNLLKIAKVVALHKGGDKSKVENYRPISVLSHLKQNF